MPVFSQRAWIITGVSVLVAAAFALGYVLGSKSQHTPVEAVVSVSPSDMRGAFGNKPIVPEEAQEGKVPGLRGLLAGLEQKVAANPGNTEQQILLAQTYKELGETSKGIKLLRALHQRLPGNMTVNFTLATLLMTGTDRQALQEAYQLLDDAARQKNAEVTPMARLYQGDIRLKVGDTPKALKIWKSYLAGMPAGDEQRSLFEERIAQNSAN